MRARIAASVLAIACALLAFARTAAAQDADPETAYRKARAELLPRLEALAAWCEVEKIPAARARAFEAILAIDAEHAAARKALRYTRGRDGRWQRAAGAPPAVIAAERLPQVAARQEEAVGPFRAVALGLADASETPVALRERAVADLLGVDPECVEARRANREARVEGRWLLGETVTARARRRELRDAVEEARRAVAAPAKSEPVGHEVALAPKWAEVRAAPSVRVLAAPGASEADSTARVVEVCRVLYAETLGRAPPAAVGTLRVLLFADPREGFAALERDTRFSADDRKWARTLASAWAPGSEDVYVWAPTGAERVEWGLRQALGAFLDVQFGVTVRSGWAWEGLGHAFSETVCGTHRCVFVRRSEYAGAPSPSDALRKRLLEGPSDWMGEGRDLEKGDRWPDLRVALGRDVNAMTAEDLLVSYLLARYLVEGRTESELVDVLRSVGSGEAADTWVPARLAMTVDALDRRLRRWVRETRP